MGSVNLTLEDAHYPLNLTAQNQSLKHMPLYLILCWIFCLCALLHLFVQTQMFSNLKEQIRALWREAEFQHEHLD